MILLLNIEHIFWKWDILQSCRVLSIYFVIYRVFADMHLMYGIANGNLLQSRRLYIEPNRHVIEKSVITFINVFMKDTFKQNGEL